MGLINESNYQFVPLSLLDDINECTFDIRRLNEALATAINKKEKEDLLKSKNEQLERLNKYCAQAEQKIREYQEYSKVA